MLYLVGRQAFIATLLLCTRCGIKGEKTTPIVILDGVNILPILLFINTTIDMGQLFSSERFKFSHLEKHRGMIGSSKAEHFICQNVEVSSEDTQGTPTLPCLWPVVISFTLTSTCPK